ncbi:MAG: histidine kinase [Rhizobacter sp.]|nr:histidine kinase [Ferruginibacter sp.]
MNTNELFINKGVSNETAVSKKLFWKRSFGIYAALEIGILLIHYTIIYLTCRHCVLPAGFYLINCVLHLGLTALLWYCLNSFYRKRVLTNVLLNIPVFVGYYFFSIGLLYALFHSGKEWLVPEDVPVRSFDHFIVGSWAEIGKYTLKLGAFYMLSFYFDYRNTQNQRIQLALANKEMQLNLLKQQLSPHFYFNTLNNLYGFATANSNKLPGALSQLSVIMEYVITDCNKPKVLLAEEVRFLTSYIALEKLRYETTTIIEMTTEGEAGNKTILPMLLVQFVENAFKHGMKEKADDNWMNVKMNIGQNVLLFEVSNSFCQVAASTGIGLTAVKNMLSLHYEGKYDLNLRQENNSFVVQLKLNLS